MERTWTSGSEGPGFEFWLLLSNGSCLNLRSHACEVNVALIQWQPLLLLWV